ncbi:hypothetical protein E4T56_gene8315 [Termitomyces sp. T112]|nr:hypothetical protein E4T56_gene8315 [Termitomyces sp. T112]
MSSPSIPVVSPADLDEVVVYDSGGEEFEHWRRTSVRDQSQSSVVVVDFLGVLKWTKFCPVLLKEGSMGRSVGKVGFLQGGQGMGASSVVMRGKHRASPSSGVGPSKRPHGREPLVGPPESLLSSPTPGVPLEWSSSPPAPIPSITEVFLCKQVEALTMSLAVQEDGERGNGVGKEHIGAHGNGASVRGAGLAGASDTDGGAARGGSGGAGTSSGGDALWVELEAARRREDWLANEAALGHVGILRWVRKHWVLLDGASTAFVSIQDRLAQGSAVQPPELQQGMVQLERLLVGHRRRNVVAPGSWWEVAADVGEALPGLAEVLAVVRAQMEVDLEIGLLGDPGRE